MSFGKFRTAAWLALSDRIMNKHEFQSKSDLLPLGNKNSSRVPRKVQTRLFDESFLTSPRDVSEPRTATLGAEPCIGLGINGWFDHAKSLLIRQDFIVSDKSIRLENASLVLLRFASGDSVALPGAPPNRVNGPIRLHSCSVR